MSYKNKKKPKKVIYNSGTLISIFLFMSSLPWFIQSIRLFIKGNIKTGITLTLFGIAYMIVLIIVQAYFRQMLMLYQKNLNKSSVKYKNKKIYTKKILKSKGDI